jgi:hypothetical protein
MHWRLRTRFRAALLAAFFLVAASHNLSATDLSGTYTADDGGVYYVQQSGTTLWWAGLSLDSGLTFDKIWHRGLEFTNVFRGTITGDTITGEWADTTRGSILQSGTLSLIIGSSGGFTQFTKVSATGNFGASTWTALAAPLDDTKFNGNSLQIIGRMDAVRKNQSGGQGSLTDNLKTYRDQTVVYGRVVNEYVDKGDVHTSLPHIAYGPQYVDKSKPPVTIDGFQFYPTLPFYDFSQPARDFDTFAYWSDNDGNGDGDIDIGLNLDTGRLEDDFYSTGWGNRTTGPTIFSLKFGYTGDSTNLNYPAFIHPEGIMYGKAGTCDTIFGCSYDDNFGDASLLPGWADLNGNSILINGRPVNGSSVGTDCNVFIQPCPHLGGADSTNYLVSPIGIQLQKLLLSQYGGGSVSDAYDNAGAYVRVTGALVVDCGHGITHPCYDDTSDPNDIAENQNQEIHPIYSIEVINYPFRPEDSSVSARLNLTGTYGGNDGSTYFVRQIGNTIWWLGLMRDRQPMQDGTGNAWNGCHGPYPSAIIGYCQLAPAFDANDPFCGNPGQCWAFANVFQGTVTESDGETVVEGDWAGVPQSTAAGSSGGHMKFNVSNRKTIAPATSPSIFPATISKMYEPEDATPPASTATIGSPQFNDGTHLFVSGATKFSVSATDADSGVQNLWYRSFLQGGSAPDYAAVISASTTFNVTGADGSYEVDSFATDNAGNDETAHVSTVTLDSTAPVATILQPAETQYGHSTPLPLNYTVSDGSGSGVSSFAAKMDGLTAQQFGSNLDSGQTLSLYSMQVGPHTFSVDSLDNLNNSGTNSVTFTITVTFASLGQDVTNLQALGCIGNIGQSLSTKISAAQALNAKGQVQAAINVLAATIQEVQAQAGKHISTSCHDPQGKLFDAAQFLLGDLAYMQTSIAVQLKPDPIFGWVVNSSNAAVAGATVNLMTAAKTTVATAVTDSAGFYYFADVSRLVSRSNYILTVSLPKGFKTSSPASTTFIWSGTPVQGRFSLN